MKKHWIIIILVFGSISFLKAQDPHFSQYFNTPLITNPALAGQFAGKLRVGATYRSQWSQIPNSYETFALGVDGRIGSRWGLSGHVVSQSAGEVGYNRVDAMGGASFDILGENDHGHHLVGGAQIGLMSHRVNTEGATFGSQYIPGIGFDPGASTGELLDNNSKTVLNMHLGALWFMGKPGQKFAPFAGVAVLNYLEPDATLTSSEDKLPLKIYGHYGVRIQFGERLSLTPHGQILYQGPANSNIVGLNANLAFNNEFGLAAGLSHRINESIIPYIGFDWKSFTVGASYDLAVGELNNAQNSKRSFELSIIYILPGSEVDAKPVCPRL